MFKEERMADEIIRFEEKYAEQLNVLLEIKRQQDSLSEMEKEIKSELESAMDEYGVASVKTENITMTKVSESTTTTIDLRKLEKEDPNCYRSLLKDFPKTTKKKAFVMFKVK